MKKFYLFFIFLIFSALQSGADQFVPEFSTMRVIRCDVNETIYNQDNSVVSKTQYHRIFRLDDPNKKIYLGKAPVDWLLEYENDKIRFIQQPLADDYMMTSNVILNRMDNTYTAKTEITYDNPAFASRHAEASGICKPVE